MADGKIQVGRVEHYAVYLALVISMITTFLLGVLLTNTLFGTGLNYFGGMAEQSKMRKASAAEDGEMLLRRSGKPRAGGGTAAPTAPTINGSYQVLMGTISVFFFDNSSNEDGFALERYDSSSRAWQIVGTAGPFTCDPVMYPCDSTPLIHEVWDTVSPIVVSPDPYPNGNYTYRVKAFNSGGASYSSTVDIVPFYDATAPATPSNVRLVSQSCSDARHHVTFTWDDATDLPNPGAVGVVQYHAYYESPIQPGYWVNLGYTLKPFTDSTINYLATTTRRYTVAAVDYNYNEGPKAEPVTINVTPCL